MDNKENQVKAFGFDALINGLYFVIIFVSFILTISIFLSNNFRSSYATCFIMVVPCILDGVKDFVTCIKRKKGLAIADFIITIALCVIAIFLLVLIFDNLNNLIIGEILIYGSGLCFLRYGLTTGFSIYEVKKAKQRIREESKING